MILQYAAQNAKNQTYPAQKIWV